MVRLGYACICLSLKDLGVSTNRGMILKTFNSRGKNYAGELFEKNILDLEQVLKWNVKNNIQVYRISSELAPWSSHYEYSELSNYGNIQKILKRIGEYIHQNGLRVSFHPGPFVVLGSEKETVIENAIRELEQTSLILDMMGLDANHNSVINIHINNSQPNHQIACTRFINGFNRLSSSVKNRLTLENDDKPNQYSVSLLHKYIYGETGIPIVFDQHHYNVGAQGDTMENEFNLAYSTWNNIIPVTHMSSPKTHEDPSAMARAHADYIYEKIENFNKPIDVEIEAKAKDLALIDYRKKFGNNESTQ